jgi:glycosyltransferase involved in cell wall biosynthesis
MASVSVVIPAYNEGSAVGFTVRKVIESFRDSDHTFEVIVVDDGSSDDTSPIAREAGARVLRHPCNIGYGNALLTGIRQAKHPLVAITDADGTYPIEELPGMVSESAEQGLDMLVGARQGSHYQGSLVKRLARRCFKFLAEFACGRTIPDINSGLRVMRRDMVLQFAGVLCGGFSFTTTITIISLLTSRFVKFRSIKYERRIGKSHVRYFRDTLRTAQIIVMTILLFNPIKLYLLFSSLILGFGILSALAGALLAGPVAGVLVGSMFFLGSSIFMAIGFLGEQRRASSVGAVTFQRELPPPTAGSIPSLVLPDESGEQRKAA